MAFRNQPTPSTPPLNNFLYLPGRAGGQTADGGTNAGDNLTLSSTANATKGFINFGASSEYDEANVRLGIGYAPPLDAQITVSQTAAQNAGAIMSGQLLASTDFTNATFWTTTGWVTTSTTAQHTPGTTTALIATSTNYHPANSGQLVVITYTVSGMTTGTVRPVLATPTRNGAAVGANGTYTDIIVAPNATATLRFVPTSAFDGTISVVTVQTVTPITPWMDLHYNGVAGNEGVGFRYDNFHNVGMGSQAGQLASNSGFGTNSNAAFGDSALRNNVAGLDNFAFGHGAGQGNVDGGGNNFVGLSAGATNVHGGNNVFLGNVSGGQALLGNFAVNGSGNVWLGYGTAPTSGADPSNSGAIGAFATVTNSGAICIGGVSGTNGATVTPMVGLSQPAPTDWLHLQPATTGAASLRIPSSGGTAPTAPTDGALWYDGTHLNFRIGGVTHVIV